MLKDALAPFYSANIAPFAIALSGGGDSMALLHGLKKAPQLRFALIVDHGLREESAAEAELTKSRVEALGVRAHILSWRPGDLSSGLQEKARQARYALMGEFCRRQNLFYLLTGHHLGDQAETLVMRYDKGTDWRGAAGMSAKKYAPLWPELAAVTVIRPLLSVPKAEILSYLKTHGLNWVEDPSNTNRNFTRVRIRQRLVTEPKNAHPLLETAKYLQRAITEEREVLAKQAADIVELNRNGFIRLSEIPYPELLVQLIRIFSGTGGPIDRAQIRRALKAMREPDFKALTLAGAQISKWKKGYLLCRDAVAVKGRNNKKQSAQIDQIMPPNEPYIWDGRFVARAEFKGVIVSPLYGHISNLPKNLAEEAKKYPPAVRMTLPLWRHGPHILGIGEGKFVGLSVECLAEPRLQAALGRNVSL